MKVESEETGLQLNMSAIWKCHSHFTFHWESVNTFKNTQTEQDKRGGHQLLTTCCFILEVKGRFFVGFSASSGLWLA